jgi:GTPase involved in cell partitioning and DNA repair
MEENDDSFIIDVSKLIQEFEKFLKSLSGAYDNLMTEKEDSPTDKDIESYFEEKFPEFEVDIKPFIEALKRVKSRDPHCKDFLQNKDTLTIYEVLSFFLLSIYKVS